MTLYFSSPGHYGREDKHTNDAGTGFSNVRHRATSLRYDVTWADGVALVASGQDHGPKVSLGITIDNSSELHAASGALREAVPTLAWYQRRPGPL